MNVVFFGTYDADRHPRVAVLRDGLRATGNEVLEINEPLGLSTATKLDLLRRPWRAIGFSARLLALWWRLWRRGRAFVDADVVVVGYMGHFDVHLAALRFPRSVLVLDQLLFAADTARDRRAAGGLALRLLAFLDRAAVKRAEIVVVDTEENLALVPPELVQRGLVVPVGAPKSWFRQPRASDDRPLRVVFFGLYTPLQGTPVIGEAISLLADAAIEFTMIGTGQDIEATRHAAAASAQVRWIDWIEAEKLVDVVADHDVCLGIFGIGDKARRVVPNKVYQGAAAGCALVTSETPPQRRVLGDNAVYVPPGDAPALARALESLASDRASLRTLQKAAHGLAEAAFQPAWVVRSLEARLLAEVGPQRS